MNPDTPAGMLIRIVELERRMEVAEQSRRKLWDKSGEGDVVHAELRTEMNGIKDDVREVRADIHEMKEQTTRMSVMLATIGTRLAIYGAIGGLVGAGVVSFIVAVASH